MTNVKTIAIIGAGNMGASLLGGLIKNNYSPEKLWITDADQAKLLHLKQQFNVNTTADNLIAVQAADTVILAVKPQHLAQVVKEIAPALKQKKPLLLSVAAGIRINSIEKWIGAEIPIVRAMPNTPALIGCGATALYANKHVTTAEKDLAESILRAVSVVIWVNDEKLMDTITALSGSGPAYFFLMIEALQNAAIELGLSAEAAKLLTQQTAYGAARMAMESDIDVNELRKRVTSPGGTTEAALKIMEESKLTHIYKNALIAAKKRSEELATMLDK